MDYETLWSVSFALEGTVLRSEETRRRRMLFEGAEKMRQQKLGWRVLIKIIDVCSFTGAVWFFLTTIIIGPLVKSSQEHNSIELENKRVFIETNRS